MSGGPADTAARVEAAHDFRAPMGFVRGYVNGRPVTVPRICRQCLVREDSPLATDPCEPTR